MLFWGQSFQQQVVSCLQFLQIYWRIVATRKFNVTLFSILWLFAVISIWSQNYEIQSNATSLGTESFMSIFMSLFHSFDILQNLLYVLHIYIYFACWYKFLKVISWHYCTSDALQFWLSCNLHSVWELREHTCILIL